MPILLEFELSQYEFAATMVVYLTNSGGVTGPVDPVDPVDPVLTGPFF